MRHVLESLQSFKIIGKYESFTLSIQFDRSDVDV